MGILDSVLKIAKDIGTSSMNSIHEHAAEVSRKSAQYEEKTDQQLLNIVHSDGFFSNSRTEQGIACKVLRSRGYSMEDIKNKNI